jgi:hypothetical protein
MATKAGKKTGGRKRGTPNKLTLSAKVALEMAFEGIGGAKALEKWGNENQTEFYKIWSKIIPKDIVHSGNEDNPVAHSITVNFIGNKS